MTTMNDESLLELHNRWLAQLTDMVERDGIDGEMASEAMLTVAITGVMRASDPRTTAARLAVIAGTLRALANQNGQSLN